MTNEATERTILLYDPNAPKEPAFVPPKAPHPWRRYFARAFDFAITNLLLQFILSFFMANITNTNAAFDIVLIWVAWVFLLLLEPLCLSRWGTTPGKFLMGITVHDRHGNLLTRSEAFDRTVQVFAKGEGYCIPGYSLYRNYKCYDLCEKEGVMPWDETIIYTVKPMKARYVFGYVAARAAVLLAFIAIVLFQAAPPHTGKLTTEQFAENYNHLLEYYAAEDIPLLSADGSWTDNKLVYSLLHFEGEVSQPMVVEENGMLRSFSYTREQKDGSWMSLSPRDYYLTGALLASEAGFLLPLELKRGTIDPSNSMDTIPVLNYIEEHPFESFTMTTGSLRITQSVEIENYVPDRNMEILFSAEKDLPAHCTITLTLEQLP